MEEDAAQRPVCAIVGDASCPPEHTHLQRVCVLQTEVHSIHASLYAVSIIICNLHIPNWSTGRLAGQWPWHRGEFKVSLGSYRICVSSHCFSFFGGTSLCLLQRVIYKMDCEFPWPALSTESTLWPVCDCKLPSAIGWSHLWFDWSRCLPWHTLTWGGVCTGGSLRETVVCVFYFQALQKQTLIAALFKSWPIVLQFKVCGFVSFIESQTCADITTVNFRTLSLPPKTSHLPA